MTTPRQAFSLVCLPPDEGGLIAIGGFNGDQIDVVECLIGGGATQWRRLAPLPFPCASRAAVYFMERILVVGGQTTNNTLQTCLHFLLRLRVALANGLLLGRGYHSQHSRASLPQVGTTSFSSVSSLSHKFRGLFNLCKYKPHEVIKSNFPPLNDPRLFTLDHNCPFVFRFSPTRKATLEEKLVSVIVLVFFLLKAVLAMGRLN